jgi:hypothetical protein
MKGLLYATFAVSVIIVGVNRSGSAADKPASSKYEKMLYDLGAFPVAKLTKSYFTNGHPGKVYGKGERIDVDGWLPPYWAADYLTDAEKARYGLPKKPLSYQQYVAMLDVDTYRRTHDPTLLLVIRFTLESMWFNQIDVRKEDILRVYEARIDVGNYAVYLLRGRLPSEDAMRLVRTYGDENLFSILPPPRPTDKAYILFLNQQANAAQWPIHCRQEAYKLLFAVDEKTYRKPYREFLLSHVKVAKDWWERARLYKALGQFKDEESMKALREGLVHDPVTECRESILESLVLQGEVASAIDAILVIANKKDQKHDAKTVSRAAGQWSRKLLRYLAWAKSQKGLDPRTLRKVDEATEKLKDTVWD